MSTIPAVLDALQTLATATLPSSQVIQGPVASVTTTKSRLLVIAGEPIEIERDSDALAMSTSSERYVVPLVVLVDMAGTDMDAAITAAIADYTAMELAIREYSGGPTLGLSASGVLSALPFGNAQLQPHASGDGRSAAVRFTVRVYAQNA